MVNLVMSLDARVRRREFRQNFCQNFHSRRTICGEFSFPLVIDLSFSSNFRQLSAGKVGFIIALNKDVSHSLQSVRFLFNCERLLVGLPFEPLDGSTKSVVRSRLQAELKVSVGSME